MTEKKQMCRMLDSGRIVDGENNDISLNECENVQSREGVFKVKNGKMVRP